MKIRLLFSVLTKIDKHSCFDPKICSNCANKSNSTLTVSGKGDTMVSFVI